MYKTKVKIIYYNSDTLGGVILTLDQLEIGQKAVIVQVNDSPLKTRLIDLGFGPESIVECRLRSPFGDPTAYKIKGSLIAIRKDDAKSVTVNVYDE